jgi:dTDP-4-amino-4,6-dideoxygalactose transaminase
MVLTDSDELAGLVRSLHVHGQGADRYEHVRVGICGRLDALQAAVLLGKLPRFPWEIEQRQRLAARYSGALAGAAVTPAVRPGNTSVWAQYCVRVPDRDGVQARLREAGVATAIFYPKPLHLQEAFAHLGGGRGDCPVSEAVAQDIIALPMHAYMDERTQDGIVAAVRAAVRG